MLRENPVDLERVHFLGKVPYDTYRKVLQVSAVHVYLTYPFVLSWSLLEAMASGCLVLGANTSPVRDALISGKSGRTTCPLSPILVANEVLELIEDEASSSLYRATAIAAAKRFSIKNGVRNYINLIGLKKNEHTKSKFY